MHIATCLCCRSTVIVLSTMCYAAPTNGAFIYVDDDAQPGGDGTSWRTAYRYLSDALIAASVPASGVTEIRVGPGVYHPDEDETHPLGTGDRNATFHLQSSLTVRGGYAGLGAANPDEYAPGTYVSILSGDLLGDDGPVGSFEHYVDNSEHVLNGGGVDSTAVLEGFTITAGFGEQGAGLLVIGGSPTVRQCTFAFNKATLASAIMCRDGCDLVVDQGTFTTNVGDVGGAMQVRSGCTAVIRDSLFTTNLAYAGGIFSFEAEVDLIRCVFHDNEAYDSGAGYYNGFSTVNVVNCLFTQNLASFHSGAAANIGIVHMVNTAFSSNTAQFGGATLMNGMSQASTLVNCTFSNNVGGAFGVEDGPAPVLHNCIIWGNLPAPIVASPSGSTGISPFIYSSDMQGGWAGPGADNIDADPLFVQPGSDDMRLAIDSPCLDAGDTAALPADQFDLNDNGDLREPIPFDLAGADRVQERSVDMGSYEGAFAPLPPMAAAEDVATGETVILIPVGGVPFALTSAFIIATNLSDESDAAFAVTQQGIPVHPTAGGYSELSWILMGESSLDAGQFLFRVFIPFEASDLDGHEPLSLDLTRFNPATGNWELAVAGNTQPSPGYQGPIGDRIAVESKSYTPGVTTELGDYGVFWNPFVQKGFVWANVDVAGDFAVGTPLCYADCAPVNGDEQVNNLDLTALLAAWGAIGGGIFDINLDGIVTSIDLALLLGVWGACDGGVAPITTPQKVIAPNWGRVVTASQHEVDLDGNGVIDGRDMSLIFAAWSGDQPAADDARGADLNVDGRVNRGDVDVLLGRR